MQTLTGRPPLRISRRFLDQLEGGSLFQEPDRLDVHGYGEEGRALVAKVREARVSRKDGSRTITPTRDQEDMLREQAEVWAAAAADSIMPGEASALHELNAARGFLRQIEAR